MLVKYTAKIIKSNNLLHLKIMPSKEKQIADAQPDTFQGRGAFIELVAL